METPGDEREKQTGDEDDGGVKEQIIREIGKHVGHDISIASAACCLGPEFREDG